MVKGTNVKKTNVKGTRVVVGDKGGKVYGENMVVDGYVALGEVFARLLIELGEDDFELHLEYEKWDFHYRIKTHDGIWLQTGNFSLARGGLSEEWVLAQARVAVSSIQLKRKWKREESE